MSNRNSFTLLALPVLFVLSVGAREVDAQGAVAKADVKISYSLPRSQGLHQPVVVTFQIKNDTTQVVGLDLGRNRKGGFLLTVTNPDGTAQQLPRYEREGISQRGTLSVQPGTSFSQRLVVNEWLNDFKTPGKYTIEARLANPIMVGESSTQDSGFKRDISITARDAMKLTQMCEDLAKQIQAPSLEDAAEAALELSYVDDPIAVPYLDRTLQAGKFVETQAVAGLERIANPAAVHILIARLSDTRDDIPVLARAALQKIEAQTLDPTLKQEIQTSLRRRDQT